jgi:tetratricopeptide (TPR) repeat protein
LDGRKAIWVEKLDFDEMMLLIRNEFNLSHPDEKSFVEVFKRYGEAYERISESIRSALAKSSTDEALKEAVSRADSDLADWYGDLTGWLSILLRAQKLEKVDPDEAENLYHDGIEKYPNSAPLRSAYALFLEQVSKEYDLAEKHYLRAYGANPHHVNTLVNYAGSLLAHGKKENGFQLLDRVITLLPDPESPKLAVEIWFYAFAHWPIGNQSKALKKLKKELLEGNRSSGRELSTNVAQARKDNHPDIEWLEKLAAVINEKADISVLDEWDAWKDA